MKNKPYKTQEGESYAVLVGDIQGSTIFSNQKALFDYSNKAFKWVNDHVESVQKLRFTVGDEFQAAYPNIASAVRAIILLRLKFKAAKTDSYGSNHTVSEYQGLRIGLAYGKIDVFDDKNEPYGQSGDAWWNARKAIELAESARSRSKTPSSMNTRFHSADPFVTAITNSFWLALDQVLYRMDRKDVEITLLTLTGKKQSEIADQLNQSQPSISKRSKRRGIFTTLMILEELEQITQ